MSLSHASVSDQFLVFLCGFFSFASLREPNRLNKGDSRKDQSDERKAQSPKGTAQAKCYESLPTS